MSLPAGTRILYQGLLRSPASWARVARGYLGAFARLGVEARAISPRGFLHDPLFPLPPGVEEVPLHEARVGPQADVGLGFLHPPKLDRLLGRLRTNLFVWEASVLPAGWGEHLDRGADLVLVPSAFTSAAVIAAGVPPAKVAVVPYGFDEQLLELAPPPAEPALHRPFTLLAVLAPHRRKGVAELLGAYRAAFSDQDDVVLRIKTTYDPASSRARRGFEIPSWAGAIESAGLSGAGAPRVELDVRVIADADVPSLYAGADIVVQPTWGESFGLSILEGLAAARPVIATGWSGHMEFFPTGLDAIPFELRDAGDCLYEVAPGAVVARPDVGAIACRMRWHFENRNESAALGIAARGAVAKLTWGRAAEQLLETLSGRLTWASDRTA